MPSAGGARGVAAALLLTGAMAAQARTPPIAPDPKEGVWLGAGELFVHQSRERWSVFPAGATVNKLAADGLTLWIATDDGVIRFDTGSRRSSKLTMDDGLPSQAVTSVSVDEHFVWFGTNKGLVRYRKLDRTLRVYGDADGLPHRAVNDLLTVGRQTWIATRAGLAVYDPEVDGLRGFTAADGLGGEEVFELYQVGDDLWSRTDRGLCRLRIRSRAFSSFSFADLGGEQLRAFLVDGERVWVGTEGGLRSFEMAADAFIPFPLQASLVSPGVLGVESMGDYLFITTDQEVLQYHKLNRSLRRFTEADGLARRAGALGTVISGGLFTTVFADGAEVYDIGRDLWVSQRLVVTEAADQGSGVRVFGQLNASEPLDLRTGQLGDERFATAQAGFGFGQKLEGRRLLDASALFDYGQLELPGFRDLQFKAQYQGAPDDVSRDLLVEDRFRYRTQEEGLERPLLLQGGQARLASRGEPAGLSVTPAGGQRRGVVMRDFLSGPRQEIYALSKRYILPGSERVWVDGELLTNGTDYTLIYPAGQLAFLDPERVDDLSVIEVEYEYDLVPKKGLGVLSLLDLLPADREVGDWAKSGAAQLISEESGLYAQIDGAAPKYIDRGWVKSVYAEFRQGGRSIQVAIHDLGSEINATSLYDYDLPPSREGVEGHDALVLDLGLATSYAAKAHAGTFYLELSIDEKSDAAKASLKLFAIQILDRGTNAGANSAAEAPEWLASVRAAANPTSGLEIGARAVQVLGTGAPVGGAAPRKLLMGAADGRYEREVGEGGRLTAYGELAGTHGENPGDSYGFAGLARLRLAHPSLEGNLEARLDSPGYRALGSDRTRYGKLRNQGRVSLTGYPARWLPSSGFFTREVSAADGGGVGVVQHALARVQLAREGLPAASVQAGHSLLDGPQETTGRVKAVGQADYDFAQGPLAFTGIKRFSVRGLYSISEASTDAFGRYRHGDRVQLSRLDAKFAPTSNESAYALFRSSTLSQNTREGDPHALASRHWELNSGARSASIPGLIPQLNYAVIYHDDRVTQPESVRAAKGSFAAALGVYPGQWASLLTPLVIEPRLSIAQDEQADGEMKTDFRRTYRVDNRLAWSGGGRFEVELYELYEYSLADEAQLLDARRLDLRNRFIFRPSFASPITLRLNLVRLQTRNDLDAAPGAKAFGTELTREVVLEWLMRWNKVVTTRVHGTYVRGDTTAKVLVDLVSGAAATQEFAQSRAGGGFEVRLYLLGEAHRLFLVQRDQLFRLFGEGAGASEALGFEAALGAIWSLGDKLHLDGEVAYSQTHCLGEGCTPARKLEPRLLFTFDL
ncbi:MAG: ligand-binding sensor domain-containing protein [Myxococcaceae bacterium]